MTAALPELAADRVPALESRYLDLLSIAEEMARDPRAHNPLWPLRLLVELNLCAVELAHDQAVSIATHRLGARGALRALRAELICLPVQLPEGARRVIKPE